jgi:hypothetical protein
VETCGRLSGVVALKANAEFLEEIVTERGYGSGKIHRVRILGFCVRAQDPVGHHGGDLAAICQMIPAEVSASKTEMMDRG